MITELTDKNFDREIDGAPAYLVEFYTTWCSPCVKGQVLLKEFGEKTGCKVGKLNMQQNHEMLWRYAPNGIPYFILFVAGQPVKRAKGIVDLFQEFETLI